MKTPNPVDKVVSKVQKMAAQQTFVPSSLKKTTSSASTSVKASNYSRK